MADYSGKLITFEGSDGTGKTTQAKLLAKSLSSEGFSVLEVREPGGTHLGERLRDILLDPKSEICTRAELLIYEASRAQLIDEVIYPALESGKIVICDRFTDSTIAYQGIGRSLGSNIVSTLNGFATSGIAPDATVILKCSYRESEKRRSDRGGLDRIELEGDAFLQRVDKAFGEMCDSSLKAAGKKDAKGRIRVVDADGSVDEVAFRVRHALSDVFGQINPASAPLPFESMTVSDVGISDAGDSDMGASDMGLLDTNTSGVDVSEAQSAAHRPTTSLGAGNGN